MGTERMVVMRVCGQLFAVGLLLACMSALDDHFIEPMQQDEIVRVPEESAQVPAALQAAHPKIAARIKDAFIDEASSASADEVYNFAHRKIQTLQKAGKKGSECINVAEAEISSVLREFNTTQKMIDTLDDGAKCKKKGEQEIKRAAIRWRKATKTLETTNIKKKETDKASCKKEATAKEHQKSSLREYVHAKEVAAELQRQCKCAVINNVRQLVEFSKKLLKVRAQTIVRETVLICIVKAQAKKKQSLLLGKQSSFSFSKSYSSAPSSAAPTYNCRSKTFIQNLQTATMHKLMLKSKKFAPGVAHAECGNADKEKKAKIEKKSKESKVKEAKAKETKTKEGGSKEGGNKKERKKKAKEELKAKESQ